MTSASSPASVLEVARRHCPPCDCLRGHVSSAYGVSLQHLAAITAGRRSPSAALIRRLAAYHAIHFPSQPLSVHAAGVTILLGAPPTSDLRSLTSGPVPVPVTTTTHTP